MPSPAGKPGNSVAVTTQGFEAIIQSFLALPRAVRYKYLLPALKSSIQPTLRALESQVSSIGTVTGNLKRAVASKAWLYQSGVAVAIVGFRRAGKEAGSNSGGSVKFGPDRAYHSHLIEFGTRPRRPLSTMGRELQRTRGGRNRRRQLDQAGLGDAQFRDYGTLSSIPSRGLLKPFIVTISPRGKQYVAGGPALRPMRRAFDSTVSQVQSSLEASLRAAFQQALNEL